MNAIKDALVTALRIVTGLLPPQWRAVVGIVLTAVAASDWGETDVRWADVARMVADLLREVEQAGALVGVDLILSARAVAEIRYTRQLRDLGLLGTV